MEDYRSILRDEFEQRVELNRTYSLRSFARDLGISPSFLSDVLSSKRQLSLKKAHEILPGLRLSPEEEEYFCSLVEYQFSGNTEKLRARINAFQASKEDILLTIEQYQSISEWHYFAILSAMDLKAFDGSSDFIARSLKLSESKTRSALEKLATFGLVYFIDGSWVSAKASLKTSSDIPSRVIRESHKSVLNMSAKLLDKADVSERDYSSMTMAIDSSKITEAKNRIRAFRRELMSFLEGGNSDKVYRLSIQLHPLLEIEGDS